LGTSIKIVPRNWPWLKEGKKDQALYPKNFVVAHSADTREKSLLRFHGKKSGQADAAEMFRSADSACLVCD